MQIIIFIIRAIFTMALLGWFTGESLEKKAEQSVKRGLICISCLSKQLGGGTKSLSQPDTGRRKPSTQN